MGLCLPNGGGDAGSAFVDKSGTVSNALFWIGIVLIITTIISVLVVLVSAKNINLAGHVLETAAEFLSERKVALTFPLFSWII